MDPNYTDWGKVMNTKTFPICIAEVYNRNLPAYIRGIKPPSAMLNGVPVSADDYNNHPYTTEFASDDLVSHEPIQTGSDNDIVHSVATCADIVEMTVNEVVFDIPNDKDLDDIIDIMYNYKQQISPFVDKDLVKVYLGQLTQTILILTNIQNRKVERQDRIRAINGEPERTVSLGEMLSGLF